MQMKNERGDEARETGEKRNVDGKTRGGAEDTS